jgi:hypothetical protein
MTAGELNASAVNRHIIRIYDGKQLLVKEYLEAPDEDLSAAIGEFMDRQVPLLSQHPRHLIEVENLDETDPNERFFRFGTDPSKMVDPIQIAEPPERLQ